MDVAVSHIVDYGPPLVDKRVEPVGAISIPRELLQLCGVGELASLLHSVGQVSQPHRAVQLCRRMFVMLEALHFLPFELELSLMGLPAGLLPLTLLRSDFC